MRTYEDEFNDLHAEVTDALARAYGIGPEQVNPNTLVILIDGLTPKRDEAKKLSDYRVPDEFDPHHSDLCQMYECIGCKTYTNCDCGQCVNVVREFCDYCELCGECCDCPDVREIERLVRQADPRLRGEVYKLLTRTVTFEYQGYRKLVRVDIMYDGTVKWFVKGQQYWVGGKEIKETMTNVTLREVLNSERGESLNLIEREVVRGLGWHDAGTFWGLPPYVEKRVSDLWVIPY